MGKFRGLGRVQLILELLSACVPARQPSQKLTSQKTAKKRLLFSEKSAKNVFKTDIEKCEQLSSRSRLDFWAVLFIARHLVVI